jgi:hypothetical protein
MPTIEFLLTELGQPVDTVLLLADINIVLDIRVFRTETALIYVLGVSVLFTGLLHVVRILFAIFAEDSLAVGASYPMFGHQFRSIFRNDFSIFFLIVIVGCALFCQESKPTVTKGVLVPRNIIILISQLFTRILDQFLLTNYILVVLLRYHLLTVVFDALELVLVAHVVHDVVFAPTVAAKPVATGA